MVGVHAQTAGLGNKPEPWAVSICCRLVPRCNQVCSLHRCSISFLWPSFKSHWSSNQLRGLVLPVLDPSVGAPTCYLNPSLPRRDLQACDIPSSSRSSPTVVSPDLITSSLFLLNLGWIFLCSLCNKWIFPAISSLFSVRIASHVDAFWCIHGGGGELSVLLLCHTDFLYLFLSFKSGF